MARDPKAGDRLELEADRLAEDGRGEGPAGRLRLRVTDLLPGEAGEVEIEHVSPHRPLAWARLLARRSPPSPDRCEPACPAFGRCGGCAWQHLCYSAQLREKERRVAEALEELHLAPPVQPSPRQLGYRNRGKYVVGRDRARIVLGAYAPRSHRLVETLGCRAVEPAIDRAARATRDALEASGLPVYDERDRRGLLRYVVARADDRGSVLLALVTTSAAPREPLAQVARELTADPSITGVVWIKNDATSGVILSEERELLAGAEALEEHIGRVAVAADAGSFLQVNREQAASLYAAIDSWARGRGARRAVDLYAGLGGIAFSLAEAGLEVLGIEADEAAAGAADRAAEGAGLAGRVRFAAGRASDLARLTRGSPPDLVAVDPPRKGLDGATRAALLALAPPDLAYASCNPDTLARDLRELGAAGYRPERALAFDFMPGTPQVEVLVLLTARR